MGNMERFGLSKGLLNSIKDAGGKVFQVGGSVRDELLGLDQSQSKDLDLMVVGIDLDELDAILKKWGRTDLVGKSFGVIKFKPSLWEDEPIDISVPRIDNKTGDKHTDFEVVTGKHVTLRQDQLRRDFTCNALAKDIETGEIHDLNGGWTQKLGQWDIQHQILRMVSANSMGEDPLRILRACQFASRFNFVIEPCTMANIQANVEKISTVSKDRFLEEFRKLFFKSEKPSIGIKLMKTTGILRVLFPELNEKFSDIDLNAIDELSKDNFVGFLALFLEPVRHNAESIMTEFRFPNVDIQMVKDIHNFLDFGFENNRTLVEWNNDKKTGDEILPLLDDMLDAMGAFRDICHELTDLKRKGIATKIGELPVNGNDLIAQGFKGPEIGKELRRLLLEGVS